MKIKKYKDFNESGGGEFVGPVGPAYGDTKLQNKTISKHDTDVIISYINNQIYTIDEYNNIYGDYLKLGGEPLPDGFNRTNLEKIIQFLSL